MLWFEEKETVGELLRQDSSWASMKTSLSVSDIVLRGVGVRKERIDVPSRVGQIETECSLAFLPQHFGQQATQLRVNMYM